MSIDVQQWNVRDLRPYWRNPRENQQAVEPVKQSIERFGYLQPIVVDEEGTIIVGHTRFRALLELGWEQVPVIVSDMEPAQAKAYRIADNKAHEFSAWDQDALVAELRELDREVMQPFFMEDIGSLLETSVGQERTPPSDEQVADTQQRHEQQHQQRSDEAEDDMVTVTCPECGEEFYVSRADVLRRTA